MKILFQGDSITDAGRDRNDIHNLGHGYPLYTAAAIREAFPDTDFEFVDLGISGNRAENLRERWQKDAIDIQPDVISILIGINDTWHRAAEKNWMPHEYFEECYRDILTQLKEKTSAKIIILEQFLLPVADKEFFHVDLDPKIQITRKLAREFADAFIPLDGLFAAAAVTAPATDFAADGVHPTPKGAQFIAGHYLEAFRSLNLL
ncbi:MAG: SGNH/GDSL hydrolase family protein [Clostridia bacterium]|nr:SGNH/GDSL hydrolase family protein [Clostridia bacterium]